MYLLTEAHSKEYTKINAKFILFSQKENDRVRHSQIGQIKFIDHRLNQVQLNF